MSRLAVYEGCEPYIFISYAHRNSELVLPIIERLIADGYRVWYDDGIVPGSEWDEYIAEHIKQCSCMISMLSAEYMESKNCKDELKFARNVNKDQFLIYLSPTTLSNGMQMRLDTLQAVFKYAYDNEEDFYDKLYKADMLECCKVGYVPVTDNAPPTANETVTPPPPPPKKPETQAVEPPPHREEHAEAALSKPPKPKRAGKIIAVSAISLLLVMTILFVAIGHNIPLIAPYAEQVQSLLGFRNDTPETETSDKPPRETDEPSTNPPNTENVGVNPPESEPETAPESAPPPAPSEGLAFVFNEDGTYTLEGLGTCGDVNIVIPAIYDGCPVTRIGDEAFYDYEYDYDTTITIPDSVTSIGERVLFQKNDNDTPIDIIFQGTMTQWNAISKGENWAGDIDYTIFCYDGEIAKPKTEPESETKAETEPIKEPYNPWEDETDRPSSDIQYQPNLTGIAGTYFAGSHEYFKPVGDISIHWMPDAMDKLDLRDGKLNDWEALGIAPTVIIPENMVSWVNNQVPEGWQTSVYYLADKNNLYIGLSVVDPSVVAVPSDNPTKYNGGDCFQINIDFGRKLQWIIENDPERVAEFSNTQNIFYSFGYNGDGGDVILSVQQSDNDRSLDEDDGVIGSTGRTADGWCAEFIIPFQIMYDDYLSKTYADEAEHPEAYMDQNHPFMLGTNLYYIDRTSGVDEFTWTAGTHSGFTGTDENGNLLDPATNPPIVRWDVYDSAMDLILEYEEDMEFTCDGIVVLHSS